MPRPKKSHAQLIEQNTLLETPVASHSPHQLDDAPVTPNSEDFPNTPSEEIAIAEHEAHEPPAPAPAPPQELTQLPLALALPQQTRRVREQVLPAWYARRYNPADPVADDPAVADHIMTMNAALTTAEQAMMTQDVGQMLFAYRALERFQ